jgi:hypothetical protein
MRLRRWVTLGLLILMISRPASTWAQAAIGEVVASGQVMVNGVKVTSGSALFDGSRLRTLAGATAVVNLRAGAGLLSMESDAEASVRHTTDEINVQLVKGALLVRTRKASTIQMDDLTVRSAGENAYRVAVGDKGLTVNALSQPLTILAEGRETTLASGQTYYSWDETVASDQSQPQTQQDRRRRRAIIIPALILGPVITVLALATARGEKTKVVSPVEPRRR